VDPDSALGKWGLSSDAVIPNFSRNPKLAHIFEQIPQAQTDEFNTIGYTIGGMMLWPGYQVDRKWSINQARGCHGRIKDRFDLTLECVRRHYLDEPSPLSETLARYADFFELFGDFAGFVDFFLLPDLVNEADSTVKFALPFEGFAVSPLPQTLDAYLLYRDNAIEFIEARNRRIAAYGDSAAA
jgi:hypothetical protein